MKKTESTTKEEAKEERVKKSFRLSRGNKKREIEKNDVTLHGEEEDDESQKGRKKED